MKTTIFILALFLTLFTSCSYSNYPQYVTTNYHNTNPDEILIYPKSIDKEYEIICLVGADVKGDSIAAIERIKKKASRQGADAVIHFNFNQLSSSEITGGSGVAVKLIQTADVKYTSR